MTEQQAEEIILQLQYQNAFIDDFLGGFAVEAFNVFAFIGIFASSLLLVIIILSSFTSRRGI